MELDHESHLKGKSEGRQTTFGIYYYVCDVNAQHVSALVQ